MADVIDDLEIRISSSSKNAEASIDRLVRRLDSLATSINNVQSHGITKLASSVNQLSYSMKLMDSIDTRSFTRLAKNISKLSTSNNAGLFTLSTGLNRLITSLNSMATVSQNAQNVGVLANNISKLGYKKVTDAVANLPRLTTELNNLLVTLSKAPRVSSNVIQMTNALANLATQGSKVGTASSSLVRGLNRYSTASNRASKSTFSLAAAFGKFYASYFLIIRGLKGVWSSIESTADYIEAYNYYNVAFGKIASDWEEDWQKYGYENGDAYAQSFTDRMNDVMSKMSGVQIDLDTGLLTETGLQNLGMNIQEVTEFASRLASVTNSVGQVGEVSLATAESLTRLAGDISSLFNLDFKEVAQNLQSGIIGQSRALYKFGLDITAATLQTYAYGLGLEKSVSEMTQAEKMQLRLIAILDQSKVSWGDLANTIQSPSNQIRQLTNNISELGTVFGQLFIPMLSKVLPYVNGLTIALKRLFVNLASFMGIDIDLDAFGQGYNDSLDDTAGEFEDVADSIEKTNKALRGFDELKTISSKDTVSLGGVDESGNTIDLTDEIKKASEEYQRVWNEAFANMENKANELADTISEAFSFDEIAKGISDLLTTVEDFSEAIAPFTKGFGEGFLGFFESLANVSLELFIGGLEGLNEVLGEISAEDMKAIGEAFGTFVGAVTTLATVNGMSKAFSALSSGLSSLGTAISAHPILSTFTLASGILALVDMVTEDNKDIGNFSTIIEEYGKLGEEIQGLSDDVADFDKKMAEINSGGELGALYEEWSKLNEKTGELTDGEKGKLKMYAERIKELCPQITPYIDENGKAFEGVADNIQDVIDKQMQLYKLESLGDLYKEAFAELTSAEIALEKASTKVEDLKTLLKETFTTFSDDELQEVAERYSKTGNLYLGAKNALLVEYERRGLSGSPLESLFSDKKFSASLWLGTEVAESSKFKEEFGEYADALKELSAAQELLNTTSENLEEVGSAYADLGGYISEGVANGVESGTGGAINAMNGLAGSMSKTFTKCFMINSPSKLMEGYGEYIVEGLNIGIENSMESTLNIVREFANKIVSIFDGLKSDASGLSTDLESIANNVINIPSASVNYSAVSSLASAPYSNSYVDSTLKEVADLLKEQAKNGIKLDASIEVEANESEIVNAVIKGINQRTKATGKTPIALAY